MRATAPPRFASWLLKATRGGNDDQDLVGDLYEEYQRRQSAAWFWRQTLDVLVVRLRPGASDYRVAGRALVTGTLALACCAVLVVLMIELGPRPEGPGSWLLVNLPWYLSLVFTGSVIVHMNRRNAMLALLLNVLHLALWIAPSPATLQMVLKALSDGAMSWSDLGGLALFYVVSPACLVVGGVLSMARTRAGTGTLLQSRQIR